MTGLRIVGGLFLDLGEGYEAKGQGRGRFRWVRQPSARFECLICRRAFTATGPDAVKEFVATIRTSHRANCSATTEGAQAA